MTTTCLLCPAPAVADGLCVDDGARMWAAKEIVAAADNMCMPDPVDSEKHPERHAAIRSFRSADSADAFLQWVDDVKKARAAAPLCPRGCKSHDGEEGRS